MVRTPARAHNVATADNQEDKKTRDKAIKSLSAFLSDDSQEPISKPDMDKLWKGIFYCTRRACARSASSYDVGRLLDVRQAAGAASVGDRFGGAFINHNVYLIVPFVSERILGDDCARMERNRSLTVKTLVLLCTSRDLTIQ
jgi:hypothetical protein